MTISFADSPRSSLGIEWELALVDSATGELTNDAPAILHEMQQRWPAGPCLPQATSELLENTVELVSAPHRTVRGAIDELRILALDAQQIAHGRGLSLLGSGTHPFSRWEDQRVTSGERYGRFIDRTQWWGRNMLIWGVHVHLGIDRRDRVVPLLHALLAHYPHLHALSASSPFWRAERTGYASNRTLMFQQLSTAGLPPEFNDWNGFERVIADLTNTGIISEPTEARWDMRPAPRWGTIEMRACDGTPTLWEAATIAAVTQCLIEHFQTLLDRGEPIPRLQPWFVRENKWRAARYGLDADVIVTSDGRQSPLRDELSALLETLTPVAERLGCQAELAGVSRILTSGNSAERQSRSFEAAGSDEAALRAVVAELADEFEASLR